MSLKALFEQRKQEDQAGFPTVTHPLRFHDDREARAELAAAAQSGDLDRIAAAEAAVAACYETVTITALPPEDMEHLLGQHKPTEEQDQRGLLYNPVTFPPALVAACVDSDITAADWAEYMTKGPLSHGEALELFNRCWDVNYRSPDPWVPKDWTGTRN